MSKPLLTLLTRSIQLFPSLRSLAWLLLLWPLLAHMSTAEFSVRFLGGAYSWIGQNRVLVAISLLILTIAWPELWPHLAKGIKITIAKTPEKRLEELASQYELLENRVTDAESSLHKRLPLVSDLEHALVSMHGQFNVLCDKFVYVNLFLGEINALVWEADRAVEYVEEISKYYGSSDEAKSPFSKQWWNVPDALPMAVEWALFQKRHMVHCETFASFFGLTLSDVVDRQLNDCVITWNSSEPMHFCLSHVRSHRAKIWNLRQDYAIRFANELRTGDKVLNTWQTA